MKWFQLPSVLGLLFFSLVQAQPNLAPNDDIDSLISSWTCDYTSNNPEMCNQEFQIDGRCFPYGQCPDCWDCDPCRTYDLNCTGCVAAGTDGMGCHWCPGDAKCRSQPLGNDFWSLHEGHEISACPTSADWQRTCAAVHETNVYSDPLYDAMKWSYEMIKVESVWQQGFTGQGVHVRLNDIGFDSTHAEFAANFDFGNSCDNFAADPQGLHGTGVASILAAGGDNDECAVGIAPDVSLSACTFREDIIETELVDLMQSQLEGVDISHNSWGPTTCYNINEVRTRRQLQPGVLNNQCLFDETHPSSPCLDCMNVADASQANPDDDCGVSISLYCTYFYDNDPIACAEFLDFYISCEYHTLSDEAYQAFVQGVVEGRDGKGIIYVFAGGNAHEDGSVTNSDGFINTRFTIAVGAVDKLGLHGSYSTTGAALFISAPGGDHEFISNNIVAKPGGGCTEIIGGSSFSAPVVSGVVALMLQAAPTLGWRDVQGILASTAQQTDPTDSSWATNAAGLHHSYKYGFGIVDAETAVAAAQTWTNYGPERQLITNSGTVDLNITDDGATTVSDSVTVSGSQDFVVESVVVYLSLEHASRGDLEITLISPSGTESVLQPGSIPENQQLSLNETWKLMTVRNWGEQPNGDWTLSILDESVGDQGPCANLPFEYLSENPAFGNIEIYTCVNAEGRRHCEEGQVNNDNVYTEFIDRGRENLTAAEACCACGGGVQVSRANTLRSWTLAIYGHDSLEDGSGGTAASKTEAKAATEELTKPEASASSSSANQPPPSDEGEGFETAFAPLSGTASNFVWNMLVGGIGMGIAFLCSC